MKQMNAKLLVVAVLQALAWFAVVLIFSILLALVIACFLGSTDLAAWVQAVGSILIIAAGFATLSYQNDLKSEEEADARTLNARAAHLLAGHAFAFVGERLEALLADKDNKAPLRLRGSRATEMIASLRQFDMGTIAPEVLATFLTLRSNLAALNQRITDVYESEKSDLPSDEKLAERQRRLSGALAVWSETRGQLEAFKTFLVAQGEQDVPEPAGRFAFEAAPAAPPKRATQPARKRTAKKS